MPTKVGGLPQRGEVWEWTMKLPPDWNPQVSRFVVLERGSGQFWPLRVMYANGLRQLLVDASYAFTRGDLKYIGPAGPETRKKMGR